MAWLMGTNGARLLAIVGAMALLFSAACWGRMYGGSYGEPGAAKESMYAKEATGGPRLRTQSADKAWSYIGPYDGAQGIHVSAVGSASAVPDLATISLGVESVEETASGARAKAAEAMEGVMQVLEVAQVEDRDIQTRYFNISPRYQSVQVTRCQGAGEGEGEMKEEAISSEENCTTFWEQKLIGYAVSNQLAVRIRELDEAGAIIDSVTEVAGDLVRVDGINFSIEDTEALQDQAREKAMAEMERKARVMADLAGVRLGQLVHLREDSRYYAPEPLYARAAFAAEAAVDTSISAGEMEISVSVSGVYLIESSPGQ